MNIYIWLVAAHASPPELVCNKVDDNPFHLYSAVYDVGIYIRYDRNFNRK